LPAGFVNRLALSRARHAPNGGRDGPRPIRLPPLSSPMDGPQLLRSGSESRQTSPHRPTRWRKTARDQTRFHGSLPGGTCPRRSALMDIGDRPAIHRSKSCAHASDVHGFDAPPKGGEALPSGQRRDAGTARESAGKGLCAALTCRREESDLSFLTGPGTTVGRFCERLRPKA
jgi:hypothetical protein